MSNEQWIPTAHDSYREDLVKHIGQVIESVWLRNDKEAIGFVFADGSQRVLIAEGDCCAHAWIESVDDFGFKGRFLGVGNAPDRADNSTELSEDDVLDINFYDFRTETGRLLVELRTSHNGFYSGYLTAASDVEIGADWKQVQ